jgi:hypothetical protein
MPYEKWPFANRPFANLSHVITGASQIVNGWLHSPVTVPIPKKERAVDVQHRPLDHLDIALLRLNLWRNSSAHSRAVAITCYRATSNTTTRVQIDTPIRGHSLHLRFILQKGSQSVFRHLPKLKDPRPLLLCNFSPLGCSMKNRQNYRI